MGQLIQEFKRRNVFRMAVLYVVAAWLKADLGSSEIDQFGAVRFSPKAAAGLLN